MKGLLISAALFLLPALAAAQAVPYVNQGVPYQTTGVASQFRSTFTCFGVSISSYSSGAGVVTSTYSVTPIFASTSTLVNGVTVAFAVNPYRKVNIQNLTNAADVFISDSIQVSSFSKTANAFVAGAGWMIPGVFTTTSTWTTELVPGQQLYGTNSSGTKAAYITVCPGN